MREATPPPYATDESRWQAVLDRDAAAEGRFYYGVTTTGVFCRPTCPARRPHRAHVRYFTTPKAAEAAGFRACRRCSPTMVRADQRLVAQVQALLDAAESTPTLAELGRVVGRSPFHLQRVFRRATGLSPREYVAARRVALLKAGLQRGASVTAALYEAGYGSSRALYAGATAALGMSPGTYRRGGVGQEIAYAIVGTPLGRMLIAATRQGICALRFGEDDALRQGLQSEFPHARLVADEPAVADVVRAVRAYLADGRASLDLALDAGGTAFQQRVWVALRAIPPGETRTYREIAVAIGAPTAARAVARACATNPVALIIPCHRVLRADGHPGGYRWGLDRKRSLLARERLPSLPASEGDE